MRTILKLALYGIAGYLIGYALGTAVANAKINHIKVTKMKPKDKIIEVLAVRDNLRDQKVVEIMACGSLIEVTVDDSLFRVSSNSPEAQEFDDQVSQIIYEVCK